MAVSRIFSFSVIEEPREIPLKVTLQFFEEGFVIRAKGCQGPGVRSALLEP
jgi:hypothetical protein